MKQIIAVNEEIYLKKPDKDFLERIFAWNLDNKGYITPLVFDGIFLIESESYLDSIIVKKNGERIDIITLSQKN